MSILSGIKESAVAYNESKNVVYKALKVRNTAWKEKEELGQNERFITPGFFSPFVSFADVCRQLRSPVVAPGVCMVAFTYQAAACVGKLLISAVNLCFWDLHLAKSLAKESANHLIGALVNLYSAVVDTLLMALSILTRTLGTIGFALKTGAVATKNYFSKEKAGEASPQARLSTCLEDATDSECGSEIDDQALDMSGAPSFN